MEEQFDEPCNAYYKIFTDKPTGGYKYRYLSPFEFKDVLTSTAVKSVGAENVRDAGRGNPNFFATEARYAFALLQQICTELGDIGSDVPGIGMMPHKHGIGKAFDELLRRSGKQPGAKFLKAALARIRRISRMNKDDFVHDVVVSTIGCYYPVPPRVQHFVEPVLIQFLDKHVYRSKTPLQGKVHVMPTEGCAAAIIYVFDSLKYNGLVKPGDSIGVMTPIFSPYLEIPNLENYDLKQICVKADPANGWEIPQEEIDKIGDPNMRALFLVNPTNPTALSLSSATVRKIAAVVRKKNPNLIILEDNVYAPFVNEFNDFFNVLPRNTIGVFSFSKYFGVTGWRLGSICIHANNIIDNRLLKNAPQSVHDRYKMLTTKPERIKFIDRILADSRQIAEAHVAGLSTPQQTLMTLFAASDILDKEHRYRKALDDILLERMRNLLGPLQYQLPESDLNSNYYIVIDLIRAATRLTNDIEFTQYLQEHKDPLEFLLRLAKHYGTVLLPAVGFAGPFWSARVSLANLETEDYTYIGEDVRDLIGEYHEEFRKWKRVKKD
jgi:aspartate 4-decarboxylase